MNGELYQKVKEQKIRKKGKKCRKKRYWIVGVENCYNFLVKKPNKMHPDKKERGRMREGENKKK